MLTFSLPAGVFVVRAAAVILDATGARVLLHRAVGDDFWSMPGGRLELHETTARCVEREMREELGVVVTTERLLWLAETFYGDEQHRCHELGFYYLAKLVPGSPLLDAGNPGPYIGNEPGTKLEFRWFPRAVLGCVNLYPTFLRPGVQSLPASPQHIVTVDVEQLPV